MPQNLSSSIVTCDLIGRATGHWDGPLRGRGPGTTLSWLWSTGRHHFSMPISSMIHQMVACAPVYWCSHSALMGTFNISRISLGTEGSYSRKWLVSTLPRLLPSGSMAHLVQIAEYNRVHHLLDEVDWGRIPWESCNRCPIRTPNTHTHKLVLSLELSGSELLWELSMLAVDWLSSCLWSFYK